MALILLIKKFEKNVATHTVILIWKAHDEIEIKLSVFSKIKIHY